MALSRAYTDMLTAVARLCPFVHNRIAAIFEPTECSLATVAYQVGTWKLVATLRILAIATQPIQRHLPAVYLAAATSVPTV